MNRSRAYRRHHERRKKEYAARTVVGWNWVKGLGEEAHARIIGRLAASHKLCSNPWCCGNKRYWEGPTLQERRAEISTEEQIDACDRITQNFR